MQTELSKENALRKIKPDLVKEAENNTRLQGERTG